MNVICTPGKKAKRENRKREKIAARILQYIMHYVFPLLGLIVLNDIAAGYTPYSILVRNTEEGFLAINQSLVPLVVSSMDQTMGHGCAYVQSTVCELLHPGTVLVLVLRTTRSL